MPGLDRNHNHLVTPVNAHLRDQCQLYSVAMQAFEDLCSAVRRCWDQWTKETSFTWQPSSGSPRKTSHRDDRYIIRRTRGEPTTAFTAVQTQAAPLLRGECLNRDIALQWHTAPTAGIGCHCLRYGTSMASSVKPHVLPLVARLLGASFQQDNTRPHSKERHITHFPDLLDLQIFHQSSIIWDGKLVSLQVLSN
ncbi:uncharacterized protein TNCV_1359511 [Trichonephila clavipes]|nr:uncharacterized protein TNCV_1359511 [Trichonephila clavipes]